MPRNELMGSSSDEFPVCAAPQKYFWLCADCSRDFILWRWTPEGVLLAPKHLDSRYRNARGTGSASDSAPFSVHASAQVEEEFLDVG
jgi:hypothetical protein